MDNKRKIALAVAAVAALGFGSLAGTTVPDSRPPVLPSMALTMAMATKRKPHLPPKRKVMRAMVKKATAKRAVKKRAS